MLPPNYIEDTNSFKLAGPPAYFRQALWSFDDSLVIIPSRQSFVYRLAQRRQPNLSTAIVNEALFAQSDTKMLASYNLVPVTTILATANWSNPILLEELRKRSPHRMGGAEKVNAMLEAQDRDEEAKRQAALDQHLEYVGKDAWNYYLLKAGLRSHLYSPTTRASRPKPQAERQPNQSPSVQLKAEQGRSSSPNSGAGTIFLS